MIRFSSLHRCCVHAQKEIIMVKQWESLHTLLDVSRSKIKSTSRLCFFILSLLLAVGIISGCVSESSPSKTVAPATATAIALSCVEAAVARYLHTDTTTLNNFDGYEYFDGYDPAQHLAIITNHGIHEQFEIAQNGSGCNDWKVVKCVFPQAVCASLNSQTLTMRSNWDSVHSAMAISHTPL